jgi:DNA primase
MNGDLVVFRRQQKKRHVQIFVDLGLFSKGKSVVEKNSLREKRGVFILQCL